MSITRLKKWPKSVRPEDQVQDVPPATAAETDGEADATETESADESSAAPASGKRKGGKKK